jgi:hypothetical protein
MSSYLDEVMHDDTVLPTQYFDLRHSRHDTHPNERRLFTAAFELHLEDWRRVCTGEEMPSSYRPSGLKNLKADLLLWLNDRSEVPCSFRWYCMILSTRDVELDPELVKRRILAGQVTKVRHAVLGASRSVLVPPAPRSGHRKRKSA